MTRLMTRLWHDDRGVESLEIAIAAGLFALIAGLRPVSSWAMPWPTISRRWAPTSPRRPAALSGHAGDRTMRPVASGLILVLMTFWTAVALGRHCRGRTGQRLGSASLPRQNPGALGAALERARAAAFQRCRPGPGRRVGAADAGLRRPAVAACRTRAEAAWLESRRSGGARGPDACAQYPGPRLPVPA